VTRLSVFWYQVQGEYPFRPGAVEGMSVRNKLELFDYSVSFQAAASMSRDFADRRPPMHAIKFHEYLFRSLGMLTVGRTLKSVTMQESLNPSVVADTNRFRSGRTSLSVYP
jgi:hypothetical protein